MAKITIIGTGLIGTSLAMALKRAQLRNVEIVGTDSDSRSRGGAQKSGAFDHVENRLMSAVRDVDIVVLATPVMAMQELMEILGHELPEGCLVTDVGSSKRVVMDWAEQYLPKTIDFVGGHPMAGRETPGPENADANLFRDKAYCVIPSPMARQQAVSEVATLVQAVGARPFYIGVDEHDSFVAAASHLPFLLSVGLMGCTSKSANWDDIAQLASSGYHDLTRLASGDPIMHRDICVTNSQHIVAWIDAFIRELYEIRKSLDTQSGEETQKLQQTVEFLAAEALEKADMESDTEGLQKLFEDASEARARWLAGDINSRSRQSSPEIPSFAESMGEMFAGRRIMEAQRRFFGGGDRDKDKR